MLSRGLSFCPTNRFNPFSFEIEMFRFERSLKLKQFFSTSTLPDNARSLPFRLKSKFMPPGHFPSIESYIQTVKYDTHQAIQSLTPRFNITPKERRALTSLINDNTIIVKPADKGGAVVVMDYSNYQQGMISLPAIAHLYVVLGPLLNWV